jgi:hypothetical protein
MHYKHYNNYKRKELSGIHSTFCNENVIWYIFTPKLIMIINNEWFLLRPKNPLNGPLNIHGQHNADAVFYHM